MHISFYFRKKVPYYHSIETLFETIQIELNKRKISFSNHFVKYESNNFLKIAYNLFFTNGKKNVINHITGDIHYIVLFKKYQNNILTIHDLEIIERKKGLQRLILLYLWFKIPVALSRYVTVISEETKIKLIKNARINPDKVFIIPNCYNPKITYTEKEFNFIKPVILQIGTAENKNIIRLARALNGIPCKLKIIGQLTHEQIITLNQNSIDFITYNNLNFDEIIEQYKQCDIVSFVSTYEGFGLPLIEAQATGRPVITSNISSMPEIAGNGACLVNPLSIEDIRLGILQIITNDNYRKQLISHGLINTTRFKVEKITDQYIELYKKI